MAARSGGARLLAAVAAILWGTAGVAAALGAVGAPGVSVAAVRLAGGGLLLAAVMARAVSQVVVGLLARRYGRGALAWAVSSVMAVAAYQVLIFRAFDTAGVATGTLVALGLAPVATGLLHRATGGAAPAPLWYVSTATALAGLVLLVGPGSGTSPWAVAPAVVAAVAYAVYAVGAASLITRGAPPGGVVGLYFGAAGVLLLPALAFDPPTWVLRPPGLLTAVWLGAATVALAYWLFGRALRRLEPGEATTITLAEPATAAVLGVAVLGERLTPVAWSGVSVIAATLVGTDLLQRRLSRGRGTVPGRPAGPARPGSRSDHAGS